MIVLDASALVDALGAAEGTTVLVDRIRQEDLHAPALLDFEVLSALRGLTLGAHLSARRALDLLADLDDLPIERWGASAALTRRAFALRSAVSADDAAYVALAEALDCPLVTRDARLARSTGHDALIELY